MIRPKITPFLWFDGKAEEAARFYASVFPDSAVTGITPGPDGAALVVAFQLAGVPFLALNGGPQHPFTEAVSFVIDCETQADVDHYWDALTADGGAPIACGWLKDKYGLRWQVTPVVLMRLIQDPDPVRAKRAFDAMNGMIKLDIAAIQAAADGV